MVDSASEMPVDGEVAQAEPADLGVDEPILQPAEEMALPELEEPMVAELEEPVEEPVEAAPDPELAEDVGGEYA